MQLSGQSSSLIPLGGPYFFEISYRDGVFTDENGDKTGGWCSEIYKHTEPTDIIFLSESQRDCGMLAQDFYNLFIKRPETGLDLAHPQTLQFLTIQSTAARMSVLSLITNTSTHQILLHTIAGLIESRVNTLLTLKLMLENRTNAQVKLGVAKKLVDIAKKNLQCAEEALTEVVGELERVD